MAKMRIRTVKPDFFKHETLYDLEESTGLPCRVTFAGLWCAADREGRFEWRPRILQTDILPYDKSRMDKVLDVLEGAGFVVKYEADGKFYGWIPTFNEHQRPNKNEAASTIPEPPKNAICDNCHENAHACTCIHKKGRVEVEGGGEGELEQNTTTTTARERVFMNLTEEGQQAGCVLEESARNKAGLWGEVEMVANGVRGIQPTWEAVSVGLADMVTRGEPPTPAKIRSHIKVAMENLESLRGDTTQAKTGKSSFLQKLDKVVNE